MIAAANRVSEWLTGALERTPALDPLGDALGTAFSKAIPRGPVNEVLSGTPTGHPAHPALVLLPIGSWLSATLLDLVGGMDSRRAATRLVGLGNLAALPAAVAGASDWMDTTGAERRVGLVHALANVTGLGLYTASWVARRRGSHRAGMTLALGGVAVTGAAGWLGGHLAYALGVGVDTTAFQVLTDEWTDVAAEEQVGDQPLMVRPRGIPVLLVRHDGAIRALSDRCTHRGGPLHEGTVRDGCVTCPWHGSRYRLADGGVDHGPATRAQSVLEVRVVDGRVQVRRSGEVRSLRQNPVT